MNRYLSERLMTIDEAVALSHSAVSRETSDERRPSIWAWQTVEGALAQSVTEEQVNGMLRARRHK